MCVRLDGLDLAASGLESFDACFDGSADFGVETFAEVLLGDADAEAFCVLVGFDCIVLNRAWRTGGVVDIRTGYHFEDLGCVPYVGGERADPVERGSEGDQAVTGDASVGGQHADYAAEAGWLANRSTSIGAERGHGQIGRNRGCRTAAGATGNSVGVYRVAYRAVGGVLVGGAHCEFIAVELAQQHRSSGLEVSHCGGVIGRVIALQDRGAGSGRSALHHQDIFNADGNACERA